MKKVSILCILILFLSTLSFFIKRSEKIIEIENNPKPEYWFILHRKSNIEYLYEGIPGNANKSKLLKIFKVKTGIPGERPTPLPKLLGKEYWMITAKSESKDNPETAPYFLTLNIPAPYVPPFGPSPYLECGGQCQWELPGEFGLHGVGGDETRLAPENQGSSGCIRHKDQDITYLYNLLEPEKKGIRYYIENI